LPYSISAKLRCKQFNQNGAQDGAAFQGRGRWWVDLSPAGGPAALGPFALRSQAIAAERDWLAAHLESADRPFLGASKAGPD